jgi:hypothetical protein
MYSLAAAIPVLIFIEGAYLSTIAASVGMI